MRRSALDLNNHGDDHRAPPQLLVDQLGDGVVHVFLNQVQLARPCVGGVLERVLDQVAQVLDQRIGLLEDCLLYTSPSPRD